MFIWGLVLFCLGVLALLDSQLNYGYLFRTTNSMMFLLVSLGVLIRTRVLNSLGYKERLIEYNSELKARVNQLKNSQVPAEKGEPKREMAV